MNNFNVVPEPQLILQRIFCEFFFLPQNVDTVPGRTIALKFDRVARFFCFLPLWVGIAQVLTF
jgi:hypothetical protein